MNAIEVTNSLFPMLLRHIRYFLAVAEQGNFTRAAEVLHVSQPTLSQQIRQLETTLGVQLFDRSGRSVRLTDAGGVWMAHAQRALQDVAAGARAIHDVQDLRRGTLRLGLTPTFTSYFLGPCVGVFNARYPGITLDIREMAQDEMESLLSTDALDVGIAFGEVQSPDIEAEVLLIESLMLVVGKSHPLATTRDALSMRDFEREKLVLLNATFATRHYIDQYCRRHGGNANVLVEVNSISAIIEIVRQGSLATILPEAIAHEHALLHARPLDPPLPTRKAVLLQRKGAYRSAAAKAFRDVAIAFGSGDKLPIHDQETVSGGGLIP